MINIQKPPMPIIPEGENIQKYIVLKDFWLRDICLKKGQIITDPVSPRWIDLQLIAKYSGIIVGRNEEYDAAVKIAEESCECQPRKKRKYTRRKPLNEPEVQTEQLQEQCECHNDSAVILEVPEVSEVIVNEINKPLVDEIPTSNE